MIAQHQAQNLLRPKNSAPTHTPWITITGGKGGVGKTLIAVNLALLAAESGYRVLLVDLDPGLANIDVHLRLSPTWTVEDLASGRCTGSEALVDGPGGIKVLSGCSGSTQLIRGGSTYITKVLRSIKHVARHFDVVICDTGAGIGESVVQAAATADLTLAVTTPDPAAVTDAYALCKVLLGASQQVPHLIVNRVDSREQAMQTSTKLASVLRRFQTAELNLAGWLHQHRSIEASVLAQRPATLDQSSPARDDLRAVLASALSQLPSLSHPGKAERRAVLHNLSRVRRP